MKGLSFSQIHVLRELVRRGPISRSNTNATMNALEKRGLVTHEQTPTSRIMLEFVWTITDTGRAAI